MPYSTSSLVCITIGWMNHAQSLTLCSVHCPILASFLLETTVTKVLSPIVTHCNFISLRTCIMVLKTKQKKNKPPHPQNSPSI